MMLITVIASEVLRQAQDGERSRTTKQSRTQRLLRTSTKSAQHFAPSEVEGLRRPYGIPRNDVPLVLLDALCNRRGFTLVELLVVAVILAVSLTVLYTSFRMGLSASARTEAALIDQRETEVFLFQLKQELKNAIPYTQSEEQEKNQFVGKKNSLRFPALIYHYSAKEAERDIYLISYEIKGRRIIRSERKFRTRSLREGKEVKETLFKKLKRCKFEYLYLNPSDELVWEDEWLNNPFVGVPRAVRVSVSGDVFGKEERTFEILIPHGVLLKKFQ